MLKVTIIQSPLVWQDKAANLAAFEQKMASVTDTDLIVLPEMFTTGFSMESALLADTMDGTAIKWMEEQAKKKDCVVVGSLIIKSDTPSIPPQRGRSNKFGFIKYDPKLKVLASSLRQNATIAEKKLWNRLKQDQLGVDFHRQKPIGKYIVDFFCAELGLVIEVDGYSHDFEEVQTKDEKRQKELEALGLTFLRFTDNDVLNDIENVIRNIEHTIPSLRRAREVYFNRLVWMRPNGTYETYDKRHLFRFAGENEHFSAGENRLVVELKGWKICPLICFDLRFPVWSRNIEVVNNEQQPAYDLLIYVANWPEVRNMAWKTLLQARAHENQCYVVGVNRVGEDGNGIVYSGDSAIIEPKGNVISSLKAHEEGIETITLNLAELNDFRQKFPVVLDADRFTINK